jgi:hypothetical protein
MEVSLIGTIVMIVLVQVSFFRILIVSILLVLPDNATATASIKEKKAARLDKQQGIMNNNC